MRKTLKILHVLQSNKYSGAENVACQIIDLFRDDEDIEIVYASADGEIKDVLKQRGIKFLPMRKLDYRELKKIMHEFDPDVIHAHDMRASILSALFHENRKVISHVHSSFADMSSLTVKSFLFYMMSRYFRHIFWVSDEAYTSYYFKNKIEKKSSVLCNVIEKKQLYLQVEKDQKEYNHDVIFLGRLNDIKDPFRFLKIMEEVLSDYEALSIAIVGDGDYYQNLNDEVSKSDLQGHVTFYGFVENPYKILSSSKLLMMTSKNEGTPMVSLEAMALGVPILSTPVGGLVDIIDQNRTGFYSYDNEELAKRTVALLKDDELRKTYNKASKERFKLFCDITKYKEEIVKAYKG